MLGYLGVILSSDVLIAGRTYTFTFESGEWFFWGSTTDIKNGLAERMANFGEIIKVSRGLFSNRYAVTVVPTTTVNLSSWLSAFDTSWRDMGYETITFVTVEGGVVPAEAGGIRELTEKAGEDILAPITGAVAESLKPLLPYILGIVGVYFLVTMGPRLTRKGA